MWLYPGKSSNLDQLRQEQSDTVRSAGRSDGLRPVTFTPPDRGIGGSVPRLGENLTLVKVDYSIREGRQHDDSLSIGRRGCSQSPGLMKGNSENASCRNRVWMLLLTGLRRMTDCLHTLDRFH